MPCQVNTRTNEALRATLAHVEQQTDIASDDPSVATLKAFSCNGWLNSRRSTKLQHKALSAPRLRLLSLPLPLLPMTAPLR